MTEQMTKPELLSQIKSERRTLEATLAELSEEQMRAIATKITDNTRRFNIREGLTAAEDLLPKRFSKMLPEVKQNITGKQMTTLLQEYYAARKWDENGVPGGDD